MGRWLPTGVNGEKCVFIGDAAPMADQKYARQMSNVNVCEFVRSRKVTVDDLAGRVAWQGVQEIDVARYGEAGQPVPHVLLDRVGVEPSPRVQGDPGGQPLAVLDVRYPGHSDLTDL